MIPRPRDVADKKANKKKNKTIKRKVRSLQLLVPGRPVPVNHHPHQGSPLVKGMCSLNFWISLFLSHCFFSLSSCISVIPLHITNILILVFPPFSSDRESPIDSSEGDETYLPNPSSAESETSTKRKKGGRPSKTPHSKYMSLVLTLTLTGF